MITDVTQQQDGDKETISQSFLRRYKNLFLLIALALFLTMLGAGLGAVVVLSGLVVPLAGIAGVLIGVGIGATIGLSLFAISYGLITKLLSFFGFKSIQPVVVDLDSTSTKSILNQFNELEDDNKVAEQVLKNTVLSEEQLALNVNQDRRFSVFATEKYTQQLVTVINGDESLFTTYSAQEVISMDDKLPTIMLIQQIKTNLAILEQLKYPNGGPWTYKRALPKPGCMQEKTIIKIDYNPNIPIISDYLVIRKKMALSIRKLSILGGILTLLDEPDFLTADKTKKQAIKAYIVALTNEIVMAAVDKSCEVPFDVNNNFNTFIQCLNDRTARIASIDLNQAIRSIREAERYFIADYNQHTALMTVTSSKIIQLDDSINHQLTQNQKDEYTKIHDTYKPNWFNRLSQAEQCWYLKKIPKHLSNNEKQKWHAFERLFKSSVMQQTPGVANLRVNYLIIKNQAPSSFIVLSTALRSATPVLYGMGRDYQEQTQENVTQMCELAVKLAQSNFQQLWGDFFKGEKEKPPLQILMQSLLSDKVFGTDADRPLIVAQKSAIQTIIDKINTDEQLSLFIKLMYHNNPTNIARLLPQPNLFFVLKTLFIKNKDDDIEEILIEGQKFLDRVLAMIKPKNSLEESALISLKAYRLLDKNTLADTRQIHHLDINENQQAALISMINIAVKFHELASMSTMAIGNDRRNKEEYKIALKKMFLDAMGGCTVHNCKSGKDRTGQSEAYQDGMTLYAASNHHTIPLYNATDVTRTDFVDLCVTMNSSMKIHEVAAFNTPGSVGTKADLVVDIIDSQVSYNKKFDKLYAVNCELAALNKCPIHKQDETIKPNDIANVENAPNTRLKS